ncbi:MAG: hypothetical protein ABL958_04985, partial [Bdellovibrionia bacterium]
MKLFTYSGGYVDRTSYALFQNIRNAAGWAQSLYNSNLPDICTGTGKNFLRDDFAKLMPMYSIKIPAWVDSIDLAIVDRAAACGTASASPKSVFNLAFKVYGAPDGGRVVDCSSTVQLSFPSDSVKPTLSAKVSADGIPVLPGGCTGAGPADASYRTVDIEMKSGEPGVLFLCRRGSTFESDPLDKFVSCADLTLGAQAATLNPS